MEMWSTFLPNRFVPCFVMKIWILRTVTTSPIPIESSLRSVKLPSLPIPIKFVFPRKST